MPLWFRIELKTTQSKLLWMPRLVHPRSRFGRGDSRLSSESIVPTARRQSRRWYRIWRISRKTLNKFTVDKMMAVCWNSPYWSPASSPQSPSITFTYGKQTVRINYEFLTIVYKSQWLFSFQMFDWDDVLLFQALWLQDFFDKREVFFLSKPKLYLKPEQPPPWTVILKYLFLPRWVILFISFRASLVKSNFFSIITIL